MTLCEQFISLRRLSAIVSLSSVCFAQNTKYKIQKRADGGYNIEISYNKQLLYPFTVEGAFPKDVRNYSIELIGKGKDWSYKNQRGFYYSKKEIPNMPEDLGYAWVDSKRENIYLNFYAVKSPDKIIPAVINGKYSVEQKQ